MINPDLTYEESAPEIKQPAQSHQILASETRQSGSKVLVISTYPSYLYYPTWLRMSLNKLQKE